MQRDLEMEAASTMALDSEFVYVATANSNSTWQEVQIIERSANMIGELVYSVRSVDAIYPELEMDMELTEGNFSIPTYAQKPAKSGEPNGRRIAKPRV